MRRGRVIARKSFASAYILCGGRIASFVLRQYMYPCFPKKTTNSLETSLKALYSKAMEISGDLENDLGLCHRNSLLVMCVLLDRIKLSNVAFVSATTGFAVCLLQT